LKFNVGDIVCLERNHYEVFSWAREGSRQWASESGDSFMYGVVLATWAGEDLGDDALPACTVQFRCECITLPTEYFESLTST